MLGVKISHCDDFISLYQQHFIESLLRLYSMDKCKPVGTPLPHQAHMGPASEDELEKLKALKVSYWSAIGRINYLRTVTRPDLLHTVSSLSQFLENPGMKHWHNFLHVLKYLRGTENMGLVYSLNSEEGIRAYSDTDWRNCQETHRSVTGFLVTFKGNLAIWNTRKQPTVSLSTTAAEYKALCDLTSEIVWFWHWCQECSLFETTRPIPVHEDNQSCISTVEGKSNLNQKRMKHIKIQFHFIKEVVKNSTIPLIYTPTNLMLVDFLTNSMNCLSLSHSLDSLGILHLSVKGGVENNDQDQPDLQPATPKTPTATPPQ
ncbi:hypothetical protein O181_037673 [Austropuccinia psidii MF-1]|uniref:Reverse transcriptase Ty1/copia-type domain-containing protein n=1 Tax=Austropuccinia psidii MF-1 TaxID=1389203 RepID=A0A9Q3D9X3_9BASI|nr:hypothetical protein [Austropuccinia psidii MF-1]